MQNINVHGRFNVNFERKPTNEQKLKAISGNLTGRGVVQLVGMGQDNALFEQTVGPGIVPKNNEEKEKFLNDHHFVPLILKDFSKLDFPEQRIEARALRLHEVVFVKMEDLAKIGIPSARLNEIKTILNKNIAPELKILQTKTNLNRGVGLIVFFQELKDSVLLKWAAPIEGATVERAQALFTRPKILLNLEQREQLILARSGGSTTVQNDPAKRNDWIRAEQFVMAKALDGENLTLEDICMTNRLINGSDNQEIEGGVLRNGPMLLGGFGGASYLHEKDVSPLMDGIIQSMNEGLARGDNPIILAATVYQRMVSVHPFPDGNGRTCRLVMDYILTRAGIPPPSLEGTEINAAIFGQSEEYKAPLVTPTQVVENIMTGIERTYNTLNVG